MGTSSLVQTSLRACIKYVKTIKDVGDAPYDLVRPILQKVENPTQLHELELNSPHLTEHDAELWLEFIKRDVPFWAEVKLPEKPDYKVYCSLRKQVVSEVDEDAERMRKALRGLDRKKRKHGSKFVEHDENGLPKLKPTNAQRFANYDRLMGGIEPVFVLNPQKENSKGITPYDRPNDTGRWKIATPKFPPKAPPARKSALPSAVKRNERLSIPTHRLSGMAPKVTKAPKSFVEDYKYERLAANNRPPPRGNAATPAKPSTPTTQKKGITSSAPSVSRANAHATSHQSQGAGHPKPSSQMSKPKTTTPATSSSTSAARPTPMPSSSPTATMRPSSSPSVNSTPANKPIRPPPAVKRPADNPLLMKPKAKKTRIS